MEQSVSFEGVGLSRDTNRIRGAREPSPPRSLYLEEGRATKRITAKSRDYGYREGGADTLVREVVPGIRPTPGQIEVLPSPGALFVTSEAGAEYGPLSLSENHDPHPRQPQVRKTLIQS